MKKLLKSALGMVAFLFAMAYFLGGGLEHSAAVNMKQIENQVAEDAVQQYNIVARKGNAVDRCVHAGMVAAAYVQAKDEGAYQAWRARESSDCAEAGVPR